MFHSPDHGLRGSHDSSQSNQGYPWDFSWATWRKCFIFLLFFEFMSESARDEMWEKPLWHNDSEEHAEKRDGERNKEKMRERKLGS